MYAFFEYPRQSFPAVSIITEVVFRFCFRVANGRIDFLDYSITKYSLYVLTLYFRLKTMHGLLRMRACLFLTASKTVSQATTNLAFSLK